MKNAKCNMTIGSAGRAARHRWRFAFFTLHFAFCILHSFPVLALAQTSDELEEAADRPKLKRKLTAIVRNAVPRPRTGAPIPIEIDLEHDGTKLLRGPLDLELIYSGQTVARVQTPEVVLSEDKRTERVTLPPTETHIAEDSAILKLAMIVDGRRIELDQQQVSVPVMMQRQMVIASADPWQRAQNAFGGGADLAAALALDQFRPRSDQRATLVTFPARVDPSKLSAQPLDYLPYDVLLLPADGLAQAAPRPLAAIASWVRAGGSLCIVTGGGLSEHHAAFLNDLAAEQIPEESPRFILDGDGRASLVGTPPDGNALMLRTGLGRVVVLLDSSGIEALTQTPSWRSIVAHLWKVRDNQLGPIAASGAWREDLFELPQNVHHPLSEQVGRLTRAMPMRHAGQIVQTLMPASVRVIPFWVIVLILALFTLAVGPGDYFVLGLIKQRKLTWVLFPCLAVAFTLVTVAVADRYMGRTDQRRSMILTDVGDGGRVLRRSELRLSFLAKERTITEEARGVLMLPVDPDKLYGGDWAYGQMNYAAAAEDRRTVPPTIIGRMPDRYELVHRVYQWVPRLMRLTDIPMPDDPEAKPSHKINWDAAADKAPGELTSGGLLQGLPAGSSAMVFHGKHFWIVGQTGHSNLTGSNDRAELVVLSGGSTPINAAPLRELCVRQQEGFFAVVSQVSPTGGDTFEDLTILDPTDNDQWLIVVVIPEGENIHVYRRLYRGE